jgi:GNAT superfamily N-acetyltransferase
VGIGRKDVGSVECEPVKKLKTVYSLIRGGRLKEILRLTARRFVRLTIHRLDVLDIESHLENQSQPKIFLHWKIATPRDMELLFEHWPDSREEYDRHFEVYYDYGFKRCFLFFNGKTNDPVHFQFLITGDDLLNVQRVLPAKLYTFLSDPSSASQEWVYTFEKYRRLGISIHASEEVLKYCKDNGIKKLFSRRGVSNAASVAMAQRLGYTRIATAYQIQFLQQSRSSGYYAVEWHRKS